MNESITRSAGASFGQELHLNDVRNITDELGLSLTQRNTLYKPLQNNIEDLMIAQSIPLLPINNEYHQPKKIMGWSLAKIINLSTTNNGCPTGYKKGCRPPTAKSICNR